MASTTDSPTLGIEKSVRGRPTARGAHSELNRRSAFELLARPLMPAWYSGLIRQQDTATVPSDSAHAHASGVDPDRILLWGDGAAVGYGVASHQLGLPGCLAREIASATGRGVDVTATALPHLTSRAAESALDPRRLATYDSIVVFFGGWDAAHQTRLHVWERRMRSFLTVLTSACSSSTRIAVAGISAADLNPDFRSPLGAVAERHAHRLNAVTAGVCGEFRRVALLPIGPRRSHAAYGVRSFDGYRELAEAICTHLAPQLVAERRVTETPALPGRRPGSSRDHRNAPQDEIARQRALDALQLQSLQGDPALERITAHARTVFGTGSALVSVIDHDLQWCAAGAGAQPVPIDRTTAFCDHTIRRAEPLVVEDATRDPRFRDNPYVVAPGGIRFYAGFPIEAPDGHRIGALCVIDSRPHSCDESATTALRDLALLVQGEFWTQGRRPRSLSAQARRAARGAAHRLDPGTALPAAAQRAGYLSRQASPSAAMY